jgi:hypothetical protein
MSADTPLPPTRSISIDEETHRLIVTHQAAMLARDGKANYSAALREIVAQWAEVQARKAQKAH